MRHILISCILILLPGILIGQNFGDMISVKIENVTFDKPADKYQMAIRLINESDEPITVYLPTYGQKNVLAMRLEDFSEICNKESNIDRLYSYSNLSYHFLDENLSDIWPIFRTHETDPNVLEARKKRLKNSVKYKLEGNTSIVQNYELFNEEKHEGNYGIKIRLISLIRTNDSDFILCREVIDEFKVD